MMNDKKFCPLTKGNCRKDCMFHRERDIRIPEDQEAGDYCVLRDASEALEDIWRIANDKHSKN